MNKITRTPIDSTARIHHVCYDYHGIRMAVCTSDKKIMVWDISEEGEWVQTAEWSAHKGHIYKVSWAHPEYGQVIVSCSFDQTAMIWEEKEKDEWKLVRTISDAKLPVRDAKFAPMYTGLILATACEDGYVRIYKALDLSNLSDWSPVEQIKVWKTTHPCESLAFCPTLDQTLLLAVGSSEADVEICEYKQASGQWAKVSSMKSGPVNDVAWAPPLRSSGTHMIGAAGVDGTVSIWSFSLKAGSPLKIASFKEHQEEVWCVEWNLIGTTLTSASIDGTVCLWRRNDEGIWSLASLISADEG